MVPTVLKKVLAWTWTVGSGLWTLLTNIATASTLGPDLYQFWERWLMGDPVFPYIALLIGFAMLAGVYFPGWWRGRMTKGDRAPKVPFSINQNIDAPNNSGTINQHNNNQFVTPSRLELSDEGKAELARSLVGVSSVMIKIVGDPTWTVPRRGVTLDASLGDERWARVFTAAPPRRRRSVERCEPE